MVYITGGTHAEFEIVQTTRECEQAVKLLNRVYANNKGEVIDFLKALEKKDWLAKEAEKETNTDSETVGSNWGQKGA